MSLKVLHVLTALGIGGAERMLVNLLRADAELRAGAAVVSLGGDGPIGDELRALGVPVHWLGLSPLCPRLQPWRKLIRLRREYEPDVIQGWLYHGNLAAWVAARCCRPRLPVLFNICQSLQFRRERPDAIASILLQAALSHHTAGVVFCSVRSFAQHQRRGFSSKRGLVLPNGFDLQAFRPDQTARLRLRRQLQLEPATPLIGIAARFDPMKGYGYFLAAAGRLHARRPQVHFVMAGPGVDEGNRQLRRAIAQHGLEPITHCMGPVADMADWFAGLDIATSSSIMKEAFSISIGEAMACGIPCVVTDVGDSGYIVGDTGEVVRSRDPEAMAAAWERLLAQGAEVRQRIGARARARIQDNFSIAVVAAQYRRLYAQLATAVPVQAAAVGKD